MAACVRCHRLGRVHPKAIRIRDVFLERRSAPMIVEGPTRSPLSALISPKGLALQTYLIALFEAQCRCRDGEAPQNSMRLVPGRPSDLAWIDLIASDTTTTAAGTTPRDNLLRQFKRALVRLEREKLVELAGSTHTNGRFEHFRLLREDGQASRTGTLVAYAVPARHDRLERQMSIPVEFFTDGWIHILSSSEIATYLMLWNVASNHPDEHDEKGVFVTEKARSGHYTLSRDVYEAHEMLAWLGLVRRVPNPNRRADGTVKSFHVDGNPLEPHRFQILPRRLHENALAVALDRLSPESLLLFQLFGGQRGAKAQARLESRTDTAASEES